MISELWDKIWRDDEGRVVIWQNPNKWLIGWLVLTLLSLFSTGQTADIFGWAGTAALIVWSGLEIFRGVNYFRRALGFLVMIYAIAALINSF